jgi:hypothetical protein
MNEFSRTTNVERWYDLLEFVSKGLIFPRRINNVCIVYDVMEAFRWLVDYSIWKLSDTKFSNRISKKQYTYTREGIIVLEYDLIRTFLELLKRTLQKERKYAYRYGAKT